MTIESKPDRVLALSGGVGGAKMAQALVEVLPDPEQLVVVCNTGDDFEHLGLHIAPDLDSVMYRLADLHDNERGWGRRDETWHCLEALAAIAGEQWFQLGDRDLATHIERTRGLNTAETLSAVTHRLAAALGIRCRLAPMSDAPVRTKVRTDQGELDFQHYFVRERCAPKVTGFRFEGISQAALSPALDDALASPELECVVLCPSNPYVSMDPILQLPDCEQRLVALRQRGVRVVAVSPIIGGAALKGPAAKMMTELAVEPSALVVAQHYADRGLLSHFLIDPADQAQQHPIEALGVEVLVTPALLTSPSNRQRIAQVALGQAPA